jgi:hypothetical protein
MDFTEKQILLINEMIKDNINFAIHEYNKKLNLIKHIDFDIKIIELKLQSYGHKEVSLETLLYLKEHNYSFQSYINRYEELNKELNLKNKEKDIFLNLILQIKNFIPKYDFNTDYDLILNPPYFFHKNNIPILKKKLYKFMKESDVNNLVESLY